MGTKQHGLPEDSNQKKPEKANKVPMTSLTSSSYPTKNENFQFEQPRWIFLTLLRLNLFPNLRGLTDKQICCVFVLNDMRMNEIAEGEEILLTFSVVKVVEMPNLKMLEGDEEAEKSREFFLYTRCFSED
jgi:hypothetical protein